MNHTPTTNDAQECSFRELTSSVYCILVHAVSSRRFKVSWRNTIPFLRGATLSLQFRGGRDKETLRTPTHFPRRSLKP